MTKEKLKEVAEKLKDKELFKESNDRARKVLSEIKSLPIVETIHEAANKLLWKKYPYHPPKDAGYWQDMFIEGAKWQMERSYSEEEVNHLEWIYNRMINVHNENENYDYMIRFKNIIKQFKKK